MNGVIAFANPAATTLLGRQAEELVGRVFGIPIVAGETTEVDVPLPGGESRVAELRVAETEWEGSAALLAALRDVTERKRLEEELRRQAEQLAEADRLKDQFLVMLAHELRNAGLTIVPTQAARTTHTTSGPPARPRRVLIVDDNRFSADSLASFLKLSGHQPRIAYNGHEALELADSFRRDYVLLDIGLPQMDGWYVAI
jgi:CheY-like chemotaxis protein